MNILNNNIVNFWLTPDNKLIKVKDHYSFIKKLSLYNSVKKNNIFDEVSKLGYIRIVVCNKNKEMLICFNEHTDLNYKKLKALKDYCIENNYKLLKEKKYSCDSKIETTLINL